jgi:hypothetical protein
MASSFEFVALIGGTNVTMTGAAEPEAITAMTVGPEFFALTGVTLALGHPFDESEYTSIANAGLGPLTLRESGDRQGGSHPQSRTVATAIWR